MAEVGLQTTQADSAPLALAAAGAGAPQSGHRCAQSSETKSKAHLGASESGFRGHASRKMNRGWARLSSWNRRPRREVAKAGAVRRRRWHHAAWAARGPPIAGGGRAATRPRSCSAAAASPAASTRSARCARSICWRSNSTVNQFDVYVGTSAGSFIAALCANGVTPEEMMRVVTRQGNAPFRTSTSAICCVSTCSSSRARARCCRCGALSLARQVVGQRGQVSADGRAARARRRAALGRYTGAGIEKYLHKVLERAGPHR